MQGVLFFCYWSLLVWTWFVCLWKVAFCFDACIQVSVDRRPGWQLKESESIRPIGSSPEATAVNCAKLCASTAIANGCHCAQFNFKQRWCFLFSATGLDPYNATGFALFERNPASVFLLNIRCLRWNSSSTAAVAVQRTLLPIPVQSAAFDWPVSVTDSETARQQQLQQMMYTAQGINSNDLLTKYVKREASSLSQAYPDIVSTLDLQSLLKSGSMPSSVLRLGEARNCSSSISFYQEDQKFLQCPVLFTTNAPSAKGCADLCFKTLLCVAANFFSLNGSCLLLQQDRQQLPADAFLFLSRSVYIDDVNCPGNSEENERNFLGFLLPALSWLLSSGASHSFPSSNNNALFGGLGGLGSLFGSGGGYGSGGGNSGFLGSLLGGMAPLLSGLVSSPQNPAPLQLQPQQQPPTPLLPPPPSFATVGAAGSGAVSSQRACGAAARTPWSFERYYLPADGVTRIVGGSVAQPHAWPWQASIRYNGGHICGGSLIDANYVLTAAHCVWRDQDPSRYRVVLGQQDFTSLAGAVVENVQRISVNPAYSQPMPQANDVAVLRLAKPVQLSASVGIVCLAQNDFAAGTQCVVTGWGKSSGVQSNGLQQVVVPIVAQEACNDFRHYNQRIHRSMVCAGYDQGGRDSCQGDSGGPLACKSTTGWELQGVVSWGEGCARPFRPGVYARVPFIRTWILSQLS